MKKSGYTLIELMIVIAIMGILVALFFGSGGESPGIYGYWKSKEVTGSLVSVTPAASPNGMVGSTDRAAFSRAVMIKVRGESITFSTDDRQWAALEGKDNVGKCVTATIYPYAPWDLGKDGTYHAGRLKKIVDSCPA